MLGKVRKIHFVGIGGIGMSGIAEVLLNLGFSVSGSDLKATSVTERLARLGARTFEGHAAPNVYGAQVVVVSSAVARDNPEVAEALRLQIPVIPRAEMLAELMRLKSCVAVAGAHGKTTTTSMIAVMLSQAGLDPTAVIGGRLDVFGSSARLGKGEWMVVEADESDKSFLHLLPTIAVVTNIDREHLDHYSDMGEILSAFASFMNKVPFYGVVIACYDSPWGDAIRSLVPFLTRRIVSYGIETGADYTATKIELTHEGSAFDAERKGKPLGRFTVRVPGRHNIQNALAAIAVGLELDLEPAQIRDGLQHFRGADRRFQVKAEADGILLVDDYGHHPSEIRATLEAARLRATGRIWAIFQPHRYTRTKFLMDDFADCFKLAHRVYVMDIYAASEAPIAGITSQRLVERMNELGLAQAHYAPSDQDAMKQVLEQAQPGDLILTIGAGSIGKTGETLAEELKKRAASGEKETRVSGKAKV
ncbi:MAG: UDP-N-acetylmuramate--L-alanine ligase [Deltaproteobacteria bacterium]